MFLKENVLLAIAGLKSNRMRSFLTMLGIIIGIGSVIAIFSIGEAVTSKVSDAMSGIGANVIQVYVTPRGAKNTTTDVTVGGNNMDDSDLITQDQINVFQRKFSDEISGVSTEEDIGSGKVQDGHLYANISVAGVSPGYEDVSNVKMMKGRFLKSRDIDANRRVAVVSDKLVANMFRPNVDPIGKEVSMEANGWDETFTVVGVYKYERTAMMGMATNEKDMRTNMFIPVSVAKEQAQYQNYAYFSLKTKSVSDSQTFAKKIDSYFSKIYTSNSRFTCQSYNMESMMSSVTSVMSTISVAIAAIAAIALLVGGIGVMNIMLVSVTERTREIGTRKALGARNSNIRAQFIVEAVIICLIGGVIGIAFGILLAWIGTALIGVKMVVSIPIVFISVGFSMLIGVFFGYYPAKKASRLNPIDALRYE